MRRPLALAVLVLLALAGLTPAASADPPPDLAARQFSVMSFNIHHAAGPDGVSDLDRLAEEIRASGADVVGLQEVDRHFGARSGFADQPAELAARLGMHIVYGANLDLAPPAPGAPRRQYGTAILSRFPILSSANTFLPKGTSTEEQRGLLEAVLDVRGVPIRVMTTHLEARRASSRLLQSQAVAELVRRSAEPVVLTGDLNGVPTAPEVTELTALLADSHAAGDGDGFTFPVAVPRVRIDYVLGEGRFLRSSVLPTAASDHRPVLARVLIG